MKRLIFAVLTVLVISVFVDLVPTHGQAMAATTGSEGGLSAQRSSGDLAPYWSPRVQQWESLIAQEAERRELDPDLLASLVWMESRGDAVAVGPVGAVGLMQVMPREAGFTWRPTHAELLDPATNLFWGTRTLATVVKQGQGDIFNALAAYNGGWAQIMYRGPKRFATTILQDYSHAVAARHGLDEGGWVAFFAVDQGEISGPIWVADADRGDVYAFGDVNLTPEGAPLIPGTAPTSLVASCGGDEGAPCAVGMWLYHKVTERWIAPVEIVVTPTLSQESVGSLPRLVMAGSSRPPQWSDIGSLAAPAEPTAVATVAAPMPAPVEDADVVSTTEEELASDVPSCSGGSLRVDAWPLDRVNTPDNGWKVLIFAEGHGGDCTYTYAWNDEADVRAVLVAGSVVFEVTSTSRGAVILGTVVVSSGDETQRVGMYIHPPRP
jgi:hypothetical protein